MYLLLIGVLSVLVYFIVRYYQYVSKYPKGPLPIPLIGNLHQLDLAQQYKTIEKFAKNHNGIFTLFIPFPIVIITDYDMIKQAFADKGDDFSGRPDNPVVAEVVMYKVDSGVLNSSGDNWREQRRTAISILRDFGMGKNVMEEQVLSSIREYLKFLDGIENKNEVDMRWPIQLMVANIINEVLFGFRYKYDDCEPLIRYVEDFNDLLMGFATSPGLFLAMAFPSILNIPYLNWHCMGKHKANMQKINQYIVDNVEKVLKEYKSEDEIQCFVHAYKEIMGSNSLLDDDNLIATCSDFFMAGQETTTTTLRWSMLFLALNQPVQDKIREEVHSVVGRDRLTTTSDKPKMIYTQACVHELQRYANILGGNVLHRTMRDTEVDGHPIPAGTYVNGDIHYVLAHDPVFENPTEFRPERYLTDDGKALRKDLIERTIPFSIGKRICAGEGLARVELFLGLTATVQNYRILPSPGHAIDLEPRLMNILQPKDQKIRLEKV